MNTIINFGGKQYKSENDTSYSTFIYDIKTGFFIGIIAWDLKTVFITDCLPLSTHETYMILHNSKTFIAKLELIHIARAIGFEVK